MILLNDTEALLDAEVSGVFGGMFEEHGAKLYSMLKKIS